MNDDRSTADLDQETTDEPTDGGVLDQYDDAVIAADDTGMLAGERMITIAEMEEGEAGAARDPRGKGDV
ncbi:MAG TPA: hypothetical protein VE826_06325 [Dongiaceae bacterium]|nr:hypothetical protein [Dongiaceae bacterium]